MSKRTVWTMAAVVAAGLLWARAGYGEVKADKSPAAAAAAAEDADRDVKPPKPAKPAAPAVDPATEAVIQAAIERARSDGERARMLYDAAQVASQKEKTQTALLERCVGYALKSLGLASSREAAEKALDQLSQTVPDRATDWSLRKVDLYGAWFGMVREDEKVAVGKKLVAAALDAGEKLEDAGQWEQASEVYYRAKTPAYHLKLDELEDLNARHRRATAMAKGLQSVAGWKEALEQDPKNLSARKSLLRVLVTEMDRPQDAMRYLQDDVEESWRTYVPLAAKRPDQLKPTACKELGDWYYKELLTRSTPPAAEQVILARARQYYQKCLDAPDISGDDQTLVRIALKQIEQRAGEREMLKPLTIKVASDKDEGELAVVKLSASVKVRSSGDQKILVAPTELQGAWMIRTNDQVGCHWLAGKGVINVSRPCTLYVAVVTEHAGQKLITEETFTDLADKGWQRLSDGKKFKVSGSQKWDVIYRKVEAAGVVDVPEPHLSDNRIFGVTLLFFIK